MKPSKGRSARTAFALLFAAAAALACSKDTRIDTRPVTLHFPASCAFLSDHAFGLFLASGDFDPAASDGKRVADVGASLGLPQSTRALVVDVSDDALEWRGVRDVAASGTVDVLLWPFQAPCALTGSVEKRDGAALGAIDAARLLVVGGGSAGSIPDTFVADLATGAVTQLASGLLTPRTRATVTRFASGGIVAGGARGDGSILDSAEVFVAGAHDAVGDFDRAPILLSVPRADHGAAVLPTGETLLVGGRSAANGAALRTLELIDPKTRASRTGGLAQLEVGRIAPTVLRLASGEILVAGGFDENDKPISRLEWLSADARGPSRRATDLVARSRRAFAALPAGGALAVIAPDATDAPTFQSTWVISADGTPDPATPTTHPLSAVQLFAGSGGAPLLWTGQRWLQWSPWTGELVTVADGGRGPSSAAIASPDPGLAMWLDGQDLVGMRFASQTAYATFASPLLLDGPAFVAPDRLILPGVTTSIRFDSALGLVLSAGASAFVTDATYGALTLDVDAPSGAAPSIILRDESGREAEIGGAACAIAFAPNAAKTIHVERDGAKVAVRVGGAARDCNVHVDESARVSVGFRGAPGAEQTAARNVRVVRR